MAAYRFNGECPIGIKQAFINMYKLKLVHHADTWYKYANDTEWRTVSVSGELGSSSIPDVTNAVEVEIGSAVTSIAGGAFSYCSKLTNVTIPDSVMSIGVFAFEGCSGLTRIMIDTGVTSIGSSAFSSCSGLVSITIPSSVTSIGNYVFESCSSLTSVKIGNGMKSIGSSAFVFCTSLTSLKIGSSVTSIGEKAFYGCGSLTSVTIPNSVTSIGELAFCYCGNLSEIVIQKTIAETQAMSPDNWLYAPSMGFDGIVVTIACTDGSFTITTSTAFATPSLLKGAKIQPEDGVLKAQDFDEGQLSSAKTCQMTCSGLKPNQYVQNCSCQMLPLPTQQDLQERTY